MAEAHRPPRSAAERVAEAEHLTPGALALAALVPQATRIERTLLRALRLQVLPQQRAADEAELWASGLVDVRGLDGLLLRADVLEILRGRARTVLRAPPGAQAAQLHAAHALLQAHHAGAPPLVQLEEQIAWLAMTSAQPAQAIEGRLELALAALVRDGRVGVARWAARALPRLPEVARQTRTAWLLSVAAADRLPASGRALGVRPPPGTRVVDLAALAPHLGTVALGVRRIGDRLELGTVGPGGVAIRVPASEPRFVTVVDPAAGGPIDIAVPAGTLQQIGTGWQTLALHAAGGQVWDLPVHSEDEQRWLAGVVVQLTQASGDGQAPPWLGTALGPGEFITALPGPALEGPLLARASGVAAKAEPLAPQPAPHQLTRWRLLDQHFAVTPLPAAAALPDGARVVSCGVDERGDLHPVVGTWHDDTDQGLAVHARTRARAEGCLGAPVVVDGQLAGVVYRAFEMKQASGTDRDLRLLVGSIPRAPAAPAAAAETATVTLDLLPAAQGQGVLVGWGPQGGRHHLLVDGGPRSTSKAIIARVQAATGGRLDLVVLTHGDADKIEGVGELLTTGIEVGDVWFNGPRQLATRFGEAAAPTAAVDRLAQLLVDRSLPVNRAFDGGPVMADAEGPLRRVALGGGASITVLAPAPRVLETLTAAWRRATARRSAPSSSAESLAADGDEDAASPPGSAATRPASALQFGTDRSASNAASIVLLFEYGGRSVLLPGDTRADTLLQAVRRLAAARGRDMLFVDLFVLPHGGSRGNVTPELFDALEAGAYAVCTSGARFGHPHLETIELIATRRPGAALVFNYRSQTTQRWADASLQGKYQLTTRFPEPGGEGVEIALAASTPVPASPAAPDFEKVTFAADTFFAAGQTALDAHAQARLDDLAGKAQGVKLEVIIAVGHTDAVEADSDDTRLRLSVARSDAVKAYLAKQGIEANRIYTEGKGSSAPAADNQTTDGRAKNRRVEIELVATRTPPPA